MVPGSLVGSGAHLLGVTVMKTLNDVKQDMSDLYEQVKNGAVDVKTASELANITGKFLKAEQLELAKAVFLRTSSSIVRLTNGKTD